MRVLNIQNKKKRKPHPVVLTPFKTELQISFLNYPCYIWRKRVWERNFCTGISQNQVVIGLWTKTWKILICTHCFQKIHNHCLYWNETAIFLVPWNFSNQIHWIICLKLISFLRKYTKSSKIRSMGTVTPQGNPKENTQSFQK